MTDRSRKLVSKSPSAASASERQQKYRASNKLTSIDVSAVVRESIHDLRGRLGEPTDAVLKKALALLAAQHEREKGVGQAENKTSQDVVDARHMAPKRKSLAAGRVSTEAASPGDAFSSSPKSAGVKQQPHPKPQTKRVEAGPVLPGLFNDDMAPPARGQPARKR